MTAPRDPRRGRAQKSRQVESRQDPSRQGLTLVEVAVTLAVISVLMATTTPLFIRFMRHSTEELQLVRVEENARRAMEELTRELRRASPPTVLPVILSDSNNVSFQRVTGFDGTAVTLGPVTSVQFALAPGETANGVDDNGDGRPDEEIITLTEGAGTPRIVASDVLDLRINPTANGISYEVVVGIVNRDRVLLQTTVSQAVSFRN